jgi:protein SERAC1
MDAGPTIKSVCSNSGGSVDVVFVHGLTGDPSETWKVADGTDYWPKWLCKDFPSVTVYSLGYPASIFAQWAKKEMDLHERASNMLEVLAANGIGERPIVFVTHSLGGILAKEILRISRECSDVDWNRVSDNTRMVVFLATPHTGASLAATVKFIAPKLSSTHIDLLSNDSGYLSTLNHSYRDWATTSGIRTVSYYEKHKTKNIALVVSRESSDPGVSNTRPVAIDADHVSICKPASRDALIYTSICRHLKIVVQACPPSPSAASSFGSDDYSARSETDRRDLFQKLIEAGREHEYQYANDLQNKFAQRYYKLGLHTGARTKDDDILSRVEQRFLTHVYQSKICKGATDDEIAQALQTNVIDPLCVAGVDGQSLSPTAVLQALYFLTEQCHIRWDADT